LKGYVETPPKLVDLMVSKLFEAKPSSISSILDPGCGTGAFIDGIIRWCESHNTETPRIVGIESDPKHFDRARSKFAHVDSISIKNEDFLVSRVQTYDFIIGNPPYVPITSLSEKEKESYRALYKTAVGRFDLYLLFFERALQSLKPRGRLVFVTPEKFLYVETAEPLRRLLSLVQVGEIQLIDEDIFEERVTYPAITTLINRKSLEETSLSLRNGRAAHTWFPTDGSSWLPHLNGAEAAKGEHFLVDICKRISCGVATGADSLFVFETILLPSQLKGFAYPTIAGRELGAAEKMFSLNHSMLIPYDRNGNLLHENQLGSLLDYLSKPDVRNRLEKRTCVLHKPWYAFHENPPLRDLLRPKIICKDITQQPHFWVDTNGIVVPRHSTYYIVPKDPTMINHIADYLNSREARQWLESHCQRAANGFLRIQSHVLKQLPIPEKLTKALLTIAS
jgi:SAM-dependent methyltransferase